MIKQGDLLYCKKEIIGFDKNNKIFYENDKYEVKMLFDTYVSMEMRKTVYNFYIIKNARSRNLQYLWDYFYTKKELRKQKLQKLYNA